MGAENWVESGRASDDRLSCLARKDVLINCNFPWPLLVLVTSMKSHHTHSEINRTRESDRERGLQDDRRQGRGWMLAKFQPTWSAVVGTQLISAKLGE